MKYRRTVLERLVDSGLVPEPALRAGIRAICALRLREQRATVEEEQTRHQALVASLRGSEIAIETAAANAQHYEVPPAFFQAVLGPHLKYSSCYFPPGVTDLAAAEAAMLELTADRAQLADGQDILDLGCGWGSLSLWMAARYPNSRITAVSNSRPQRAFIEQLAAARGLTNLTVRTSDVRTLLLPARAFDRVVSIEMFEHMRNYRRLLKNIAGWLRPGGQLFVHLFCHRNLCYPFEAESGGWMARNFFTGGIMPSFDLLRKFDVDLVVRRSWPVSGTHYARTCEDWLKNLDDHRDRLRELFAAGHGAAQSRCVLQRWRMFLMACAELFAYRGGDEWLVGHYLLQPVEAAEPR